MNRAIDTVGAAGPKRIASGSAKSTLDCEHFPGSSAQVSPDCSVLLMLSPQSFLRANINKASVISTTFMISSGTLPLRISTFLHHGMNSSPAPIFVGPHAKWTRRPPTNRAMKCTYYKLQIFPTPPILVAPATIVTALDNQRRGVQHEPNGVGTRIKPLPDTLTRHSPRAPTQGATILAYP